MNFFTILLIAVSLSMDTFSLSIIYGTMGISKSKKYTLSLIVGAFHFLMPFFGNLIGLQILDKLPISANIVVGIIFIIISLQMLFQKSEILDLGRLFSLFVFAFTVSLDSFSVGIGISNITNKYLFSYITFAFVSCFFTFIGLNFGNLLNTKFGNNATKVGAFIMFLLGILHMI